MDLHNRPVSTIMQREIVTLTPTETLDLTQDLMRLGRLRHLPVLDADGTLVGVVSSRDLVEASLAKTLDFDLMERRRFLRSVVVGDVMTRDVATLGPDAPLVDAARMLLARKIGCLPIVGPERELLGLVTETDLIEVAFGSEAHSGATKGTNDMDQASDFSEWIRHEVSELRRMRDELRVQSHLARAELRDQWSTLERNFQSLEQSTKRAKRAAGGTLRELEEDARKMARDLREGYRRIRDAV